MNEDYESQLSNQRMMFVAFAFILSIFGILLTYAASNDPNYSIASIRLGLGQKQDYLYLWPGLVNINLNYLAVGLLGILACAVFVNYDRVVKDLAGFVGVCGFFVLLGSLSNYFLGFAPILIIAGAWSFLYEGMRAKNLPKDLTYKQAFTALAFWSIIFGIGFALTSFPVAGLLMSLSMMIVLIISFWILGQDRLPSMQKSS